MSAQDSAIADFGAGVGRLGDLSYQLRDETRLSVGLLDDLEGDVSDASAGLRHETREAERLAAAASDFPLYVTILVNTVAILALLAYGLR